MHEIKIGFIGGGNMTLSLLGGLIEGGEHRMAFMVSDPNEQQRLKIKDKYQIETFDDNVKLAACVDVLILAVKPQNIKGVCLQIKPALDKKNPLILCIAAGIPILELNRWLGDNIAIVRAMPNTPALVQSAASVLCANEYVSESQCSIAESVLRSVGLTLWLDNESLMDAVTALSGSGPAYIFYIIQLLEETGVKLGLTQETARLLSLQTAFGATKMALESADDVKTLRRFVTSPGGTTEQAMHVFEQSDIAQIFEQALTAAQQKSKELAKQAGG